MARLGKNQIELLTVLGCPGNSLVVPSKTALSLVRRGLLKTADCGGFACITPAGLRALANEMESGRVADAVERIRRDVAKRKAKAAA